MSYFHDEPRPERISIRFSTTELGHIGLAVLILTVAFTMVLSPVNGVTLDAMLQRFAAPWTDYLASFFAVSTGFVLHELGHKIVAQRYGHWAEFRGQFTGLLMSLAVAAGMGFLFAAPGAVLIWGRVTAKENGIISIMGPGINFVIALLALPFTFAVNQDALFPSIMATVTIVNTILCLFNLLPLANLDGRKIWYWNKPVYIAFVTLAAALLFMIAFPLALF